MALPLFRLKKNITPREGYGKRHKIEGMDWTATLGPLGLEAPGYHETVARVKAKPPRPKSKPKPKYKPNKKR